MSGNTQVPVNLNHFIDKENSTKDYTNKSKTNENSSAHLRGKQPISRPPMAGRVPLRGKDENMSIPSLSRSQSSVDKLDTNTNSLSTNTFKRTALANKPRFLKSSSSLGFTHNTSSRHKVAPGSRSLLKSKTHVDPNAKLTYNNNTIFNPALANRVPELEQYTLDTDSLKKRIIKSKSPSKNLSDTITTQTAKLSSSSIPRRQINDVDPVKKGPLMTVSNKLDQYIQDPERIKVFDELVNDENSVETIPPKPIVADQHEIELDEEDLMFFRTGKTNRIQAPVSKLRLEEIKLEDTTFDMEDVSRESSDDEVIGLNEQELNDLLDF
ncbi:hypothetical protein PSN45_004497 [Yamadazyma tenuis]|uniref:Securin n=1 Tax=Candida tenuis (strain ATCC 10573 / BCRC 21748 / CBS 615 / JCM 9827 / NBRC 10315 / NRRL Y-1498 / VKM Y-70) TaxID=590646 RepID=G3B5H8_CANTC|nr:uncharacterized protein CANTEDRAFT_135060 [Yamadazyma tenuis ATCC 10573]EGV63231.1 hypothetical protein CANTEDRAFT_135060 [Yamadazyma tenuis ATCC 10573]WEJ96951.1 hypothetical protein PSN45_004497 [Yamadazyma tenuis]